MPTVDAATFRQDFDRYWDKAQSEPVTLTKQGRCSAPFCRCMTWRSTSA